MGAFSTLFSPKKKVIHALKDISLSVGKGELVGFIGPNGAGKTTTLKILSGLLFPTAGVTQVLGFDPWERRTDFLKKISLVMGQKNQLWWDLPPIESFLLNKEIYQIPDSNFKKTITELSNLLDVKDILNIQVRKLSLGQRMKCELIAALIHSPRVLFLDEPTIGLDPQARQKFWDILMELRAEGLTILLSTHYLEEAEIVCDRVAIMDQGKIVANDRPIKLITSLGVASRIRFMCSKPINVSELESLPGISIARRDRYTYDLETEKPEVALRELLEWEKKYSGKIFNLSVEQATLEDVFLKLTGHSLQE